jgi:hypothetical protein
MDGHTIKQIPFPAIFQPCGSSTPVTPAITGSTVPTANATQTPCYVTADFSAEQRAYAELMTPTAARPTVASPSPAAPRASRGPSAGPGARPDLIPDLADGRAQAAALRGAGMPVYYPRLIDPGSAYCSDAAGNCYVEAGAGTGFYPRAYWIHDPSGRHYFAYRITLVLNAALGEYYGIQGMAWRHPPILNSPSFTRFMGGKQLLVYANGGKVSVVAWRTPSAVYWISNTLTDTLSNQQMIGIAASLTQG